MPEMPLHLFQGLPCEEEHERKVGTFPAPHCIAFVLQAD